MAAIIFDFDGTIADSFDYVVAFMAKQAGLSSLDDEQKQRLRGLSMGDIARQLGYHSWDAPMLLFKGRRRMRHAIKHIAPHPGIPEIIQKLHTEGHQLFILSTNSLQNLHRFLHEQNMHKYFLEIYGSVGIFGKARGLKRLLKEHKLELNQAVYVGDELRDIEAAKLIGLRVIAVTWGFAHPSKLRALHPTAIADTSVQLMNILEVL